MTIFSLLCGHISRAGRGKTNMARHGENIHKRKDGRWEARLTERFEDGRAHYKSVYGKTYSEVKAKKEEFMVRKDVLKPPSAKKTATFEWLAFDWMNGIRRNIKESTLSRYDRIIRIYLLPVLEKVLINSIDLSVINILSENLSATLAPKTVNDILSVLKQIIRYGNRNGYFSVDEKSVVLQKRKYPDIKIVSEANRTMLEKVLWESDDDICTGILLTLYTGIRNGELCGLRWGDINFKDRTVYIDCTVERIGNLDPESSSKTKVVICEPKTEHSRRTIPLPGFLSAYLLSRRKSNNIYIVTGTEKPSEPHTVYIRYTRFLKRNGIDSYTFHSLRHTFASRCVEAGFDIKSLSEILGHSNVTTTLRCYVHPSMEAKRAQMELLSPLSGIRGPNYGRKKLKYSGA